MNYELFTIFAAMKKIFTLLLCLVGMQLSATAQDKNRVVFPEGKCYLYRITLKDKKGSTVSLRHPEQFLSQKAIERRRRQGLKVDESDLPVSEVYLRELAARHVQVVSKSKWNNTVLVKTATPQQAESLKSLAFVNDVVQTFSAPDSVTLSVRDSLKTILAEDDTLYSTSYGRAKLQVEMLGGIKLHEAGFRGNGMTIAIIDGGFMNVDQIPAFRKVNIIGAKDFGFPQSDIYQEGDHGTCVLSLMAANEYGAIIGTAPEASYLLLRSEVGAYENLCEEDFWVAAAEYADSIGVDVINTSLGYNHFDNADNNHRYADLDGHSTVISRAASLLADKGIVLVNSAGNSGNNQWKKITPPADAENVLTVGALRLNGTNANFSSVGPSQDGRVKPDIMAPGNPDWVIGGDGRLSKGSGTSFASPLACGMVACLWQSLPTKTAKQIIDIVLNSCNQYDTPDNIFGYGTPDFYKAYIDNR